MKDETVKAYARAFTVIERVLNRTRPEKQKNNPNEWTRCCERPADGLTPLFLRAFKSHAMTDEDNDLIGAFLDEVGDDDIHTPRPIPIEQQGIWQIEYFHWHDLYTPDQAAKELGVTKQRVSALMKNDQLDYVKVRGHYYIAGYSVHNRKREERLEREKEDAKSENL